MRHVLSLGAGVQSSALLLLSVQGLLPKLEVAIFADTGWEPKEVYIHLDRLKAIAADAGIPVVTVSNGNIRDQYLEGGRFASIPLHVIDENGHKGMVRRQCTREFKIEPIERYMRRELLGLGYRERAPREPQFHQWMGITHDEMVRAKQSRDKWKLHRFPFLGDILHDPMLPKPWKRGDCIAYLEDQWPSLTVPRSACIGCPYHSNHEWSRIKEDPESWADAVAFDKAIRTQKGLEGEAFLHQSCRPLDQVDLRSDVERGQGLLSFMDECDGMCGV